MKKKFSGVYCNMPGKKWVGRSGFVFFNSDAQFHFSSIDFVSIMKKKAKIGYCLSERFFFLFLHQIANFCFVL